MTESKLRGVNGFKYLLILSGYVTYFVGGLYGLAWFLNNVFDPLTALEFWLTDIGAFKVIPYALYEGFGFFCIITVIFIIAYLPVFILFNIHKKSQQRSTYPG